MGFISYAPKYPVSTFHPKNPALQDSILVFNQDCELVSQLPITRPFKLYSIKLALVQCSKNLCQTNFYE